MENTISFNYSPYKYYRSFTNALENLRKHYPNSDVFVYFDKDRKDTDRYIQFAQNLDCKIIIRENPLDYINRNDPTSVNKPKILEWYNRFIHTSKNTNSKWIMNMEDDVLIKRRIQKWPNTDCGTNRERIGFLGGGSIFNREKFLSVVDKFDAGKVVDNDHTASWAGDVLLKHMFLGNGLTYSRWEDIAEPNYFENTDHAVFHGYKELHKFS